MIQPTVGRIVWLSFCPAHHLHTDQPVAAMVTSVIHDRAVDVIAFPSGHTGIPFQGVTLLQDDDEPPAGEDLCAQWMPYQKTQAASNPVPPADTAPSSSEPAVQGGTPAPQQ